jgi:hypothetical protein
MLAGVMLLTAGCTADITDDYEISEALLGNVEVEQLSSNRFTQLEPEGTKPLPEYKLEGYTLAAENDKLALYVKEEIAGIRVVNKESGYVWGALENEDPDDLNDTWGAFAQSVVSIAYMDSTGATKQTGAGHKNAKCKFKYFENGFTCEVDFGRKVEIALEVKVILEDDHIVFSVDDSTIEEYGENYLASVYFVPFMGSTQEDQTDGYLFVPDGSGALIRYRNAAKYLKSYSGRVYGIDHAIDTLNELNDLSSNRPVEFLKPENTVTMPVYGLTLGVDREAVFGRVTGGDSYAFINASPAGLTVRYNWVCASFLYRQVYSQPISKNGAGVPVVQKNPNTVNPSLEVYFLTGEDANYSGMARLYADILTREGTLRNNLPDNAPQVALDFVAADIEEGMLVNTTKKVTSLDYIEKAIRGLNEAGLTNMALTIKGWQSGGLSGYVKSEIFHETELGSFDSLAQLQALLQAQDGTLLLYSDPLRGTEIQVNSRQDVGITLSQSTIKKSSVIKDNFLEDVWYLKSELGMEYLQDQLDVVEDYGLKMAIDGAGLLYGEYLVNEFMSREDVKNRLAEMYGAMASEEGLTLFTPNQYLLKYTGVYRDMPVSGSQALYETDSVPFLQLVLSGNMTMVAPYANHGFYSKIDLLKSIEYNVYPSYLLTEADNVDLADTTLRDESSTRFSNWKATIEASFGFVSDVLEQVQGQQMLKHARINEYVFAVTYENGTVYINYGAADFALDGGSVIPAESAAFVPAE